MPGGAGSLIYRTVFKRTSTTFLAIVVGAFLFERSFDQGTEYLFNKINEGLGSSLLACNCTVNIMQTLKALAANVATLASFRNAHFVACEQGIGLIGIGPVACSETKTALMTPFGISVDVDPYLQFGGQMCKLKQTHAFTGGREKTVNYIEILLKDGSWVCLIHDSVADVLRRLFSKRIVELCRWIHKHSDILHLAVELNFHISVSALKWQKTDNCCIDDEATAHAFVSSAMLTRIPDEVRFAIATFYCIDDFFDSRSPKAWSVAFSSHIAPAFIIDCFELCCNTASLHTKAHWFCRAANLGFCRIARRLWNDNAATLRVDLETVVSLYLHAVVQGDEHCVRYVLHRMGLSEPLFVGGIVGFIISWCSANPQFYPNILSYVASRVDYANVFAPPLPIFMESACKAGVSPPLSMAPTAALTINTGMLTPPPSPQSSLESEMLLLYHVLLHYRAPPFWFAGLYALKTSHPQQYGEFIRYDSYGLFRCACDSNVPLLVQIVCDVSDKFVRAELLGFDRFYGVRHALRHNNLDMLRLFYAITFISVPMPMDLWSEMIHRCEAMDLLCLADALVSLSFLQTTLPLPLWCYLCTAHLALQPHRYSSSVVHFLATEKMRLELIQADEQDFHWPRNAVSSPPLALMNKRSRYYSNRAYEYFAPASIPFQKDFDQKLFFCAAF